jgi:hypothetical protein
MIFFQDIVIDGGLLSQNYRNVCYRFKPNLIQKKVRKSKPLFETKFISFKFNFPYNPLLLKSCIFL